MIVTTPAATPVTFPELLTVAIDEAVLAHVPPAFPLLIKLMEELAHTEEGPLIVPASGSGFTMIFVDALAVPQVVVTV